MIIDKIENAKRYLKIDERFEKAFETILKLEAENAEDGKYEIDGDDMYAVVSRYNSKLLKEGKWENHKNYIDIQYVCSGKEYICIQEKTDMKLSVKYNKTKDVEFYETPKDCKVASMGKGEFALIYPKEVHMPGISTDENPAPVTKIVIKILNK